MTNLRENNLEIIQTKLENLAKCQAIFLNEPADIPVYDTFQLTSSDQDPTVIDKLNKELTKLYESGTVIPRSNLDEEHIDNKLVSPIHDVLFLIFKFSNEKFRQNHFDDLMKNYFDMLRGKLVKEQRENFTEEFTDYSVRVLLPVIKIELSQQLQRKTPDDLRDNITNFVNTPLLNQEDLYVIIRNKLNTNDYDLLSYRMRSLNETNGHLGQYYHLDIKVRYNEIEQGFTLFAKFIIPPTETMGIFVKTGPAKREHFFYNILMPLFRENGLENLLDFAPQCYLSRVGWLIVLDDLGEDGYVGLKPNNVLDYEALTRVVLSLAKLHSCSIIYEEIVSKRRGTRYSLIEDFENFITDKSFNYDDANPLKAIFDASRAGIKHIFDLVPELTEKANISQEEMHQCINDLYMTPFTRMKESNIFRNVICHGDMYLGNLLLKFNDKQVVTDTLLVDFQMLRYSPPVTDVLCILHTVTTKQIRDKHMNQLLEQYYNDIKQNFEKFDLELEAIYPKEDFWKSVEYTKPACIVTAMEYNHIIHVDPEFREKLFHDQEEFDYYLHANRNAMIDMNWSNSHYQSLLRGMVEDMVDIIRTKNY